jgi:hypothetical protein
VLKGEIKALASKIFFQPLYSGGIRTGSSDPEADAMSAAPRHQGTCLDLDVDVKETQIWLSM